MSFWRSKVSGASNVLLPSPRLSPGGKGGRADRTPLPWGREQLLEVDYSSMRQRHDLVQTATVVRFGHL